jgi:hypothetical protein
MHMYWTTSSSYFSIYQHTLHCIFSSWRKFRYEHRKNLDLNQTITSRSHPKIWAYLQILPCLQISFSEVHFEMNMLRNSTGNQYIDGNSTFSWAQKLQNLGLVQRTGRNFSWSNARLWSDHSKMTRYKTCAV